MHMRRVQIQLPQEQYLRLEARAAAAGESMAATVRRALDVQDAAEERRGRIDAALHAIHTSHFRSGLHDIAENHDEYFVQGIEERIGRR